MRFFLALTAIGSIKPSVFGSEMNGEGGGDEIPLVYLRRAPRMTRFYFV